MEKLQKVLDEMTSTITEVHSMGQKEISCFKMPQIEIDEFNDYVLRRGEVKPAETISVKENSYRVYLDVDEETGEKSHYFVHEDTDEKTMGYDLLVSTTDNEIGVACKNPKSDLKNLAVHIYVHYLAVKHDSIVSDVTQTPKGFGLWKRLFKYVSNTEGFEFFVWNTETGERLEINKSKELNNYYGKTEDMWDYRFVVKKLDTPDFSL